jgi:hypothetical protein
MPQWEDGAVNGSAGKGVRWDDTLDGFMDGLAYLDKGKEERGMGSSSLLERSENLIPELNVNVEC